VADGPGGSAFVLVAIDSGQAQLMMVGSSAMAEEVYAEAWDEAIRFCWGAGWEPRGDDPDVYLPSIDTEIYVLVEMEDEEIDLDVLDGEERVDG
jgi:hypothetical protein